MELYCFILAQILGALTFIVNIVGSTKMTTEKVFKYNYICNFVVAAQYTLLGAWAGAMCCFVAVLRNFVFNRYKERAPLYILITYIIITIACNYQFIKSPLDIIPVANVIIYAIALWSKDIMKIKAIGVYTCISGFFYDFNNRAYVTVLNEIIDGVVGIRCIHLLKKRKKLAKS